MKTADTIDQQEERKAARDNDALSPENRRPAGQKLKRRDASRIASWRFAPGQSGNPGGRPKHALAAEIARAVFENNAEALYKAFAKAALRGNAYAFKELADRAYGKLKETHHLDVSTGFVFPFSGGTGRGFNRTFSYRQSSLAAVTGRWQPTVGYDIENLLFPT